VKELVHCIRSPLWVVPPPQGTYLASKPAENIGKVEMDGDKFTPAQIEKFKSDPEYYLAFVKAIEEEINSKFPLVSKLRRRIAPCSQKTMLIELHSFSKTAN
jgi:hypothetical protein